MTDDPLLGDNAEEEDNWLVSYADLLTNLLAFFVMLFAVSENVPLPRLVRVACAEPARADMTSTAAHRVAVFMASRLSLWS